MTIQVTAETTPTNAELERRLGTVLFNQIRPSLDKGQAAEAKDAAQLEYVAAARAVVSANCQAREDLVQQAIDNIRTKLEAEPERARVKRIWQHLDDKKETLGYVFDELPTRKVVKRVLKRNGL